MKADVVVYDDCSVPAVLQLGGDVMDMIFQFLTWDVQQLRGDVMGDFVDGALGRPHHPMGSFYRFPGKRTLQNILCSSNQNVDCAVSYSLNGD